jgi:hypothetical protein
MCQRSITCECRSILPTTCMVVTNLLPACHHNVGSATGS